MNRYRIIIVALIALVGACESASPSESPRPPEGSPVAANQVLRMAYDEVGTLDPMLAQDPNLSLLVRGLTWFDEDLRTVPALAESWDITQGGTHITFHLRQASYSSGEPIVAGDFVYSWKRLIDPRNETAVPYLLADVVGAPALLALVDATALPPDEEIEALLDGLAVTASDDRTLEVALSRPAVYFPTAVANPAMAPVAERWITRPGATEAGGFWSSGPFVLTEWVHDQRRTFEPNPMWWGEPISLDRIDMQAYTSEAGAVEAFRIDEIDILGLSAIPTDPGLAAETVETPGAAFLYIGFDMQRPDSPLVQSQTLREALSLAVDREELNRVVGFSGPVATSPIPPGVPGHDPDLRSVFDPDEARRTFARALDELGLSGPDELDLTFLHGTLVGDGPRALDQQWRDVLGLEVTFTRLEPDQFLELVGSHLYDMFWLQWIVDFPHPQSYLEPSWACDAGGNASGYCNPELDRLLAEAAGTVNEPEQLDLYGQAQRVLVGDGAHIFVQWRGGFALVAPRVDGLVNTPFDAFYGLMFPEQIRIVAD